ncbi:MAG: Ig-like domain-containing protein [Holophaga sp.]|nr:Ig-like domain-containing protein [Holophaga sp.]
MSRAMVTYKTLLNSTALLLVALAAGCTGARDPILGGGGRVGRVPTVTAVAPIINAMAVPINTTLITAAFSETMAPIAGGASFTVTCVASAASPTGNVTLNASKRIATFALAPATTLVPLTVYTATISGAKAKPPALPWQAPMSGTSPRAPRWTRRGRR